MIRITFLSNQERVAEVPENSNLLRASMRHQGGIPFKCGGGVCGTCKCRIETGVEHADAVKPKERKHLNDADIAAGYRMACQTFLSGDASVSWEARAVAAKTAPQAVPQPAAVTS
ncbi:2Fe-2S iron-sulfur cluster-binding protein [Cupriavidus sp. 2TAF22]|uniref:2Fe-2S iron-sulfur cluster-binding protein n=1 Tax=unclassified Cupriavidus TaxID=2640874 RepID=UPI003F9032E4